jgi:hypothetical protein
MAISLPEDTVTSWQNAVGYYSNGILLLSQGWNQGPVGADGGTLHVFFVASGSETTPQDCGFDTLTCSM